MKNQYININSISINELETTVNMMIQKGFNPIGGLSFIKVGEKYVFNQSMYCSDPNNINLEEFLDPFAKARELKMLGKDLESIKTIKDFKGCGLVEAKDIFDAL